MNESWRTSTYSQGVDNCAEARMQDSPAQVHLRDTQHRGLGALAFPAAEWRSFITDLKTGRL
jgi:hypothetical protein